MKQKLKFTTLLLEITLYESDIWKLRNTGKQSFLALEMDYWR